MIVTAIILIDTGRADWTEREGGREGDREEEEEDGLGRERQIGRERERERREKINRCIR